MIGATGTIGKALVTALSGRHEVIRATRRLGIKVDIEDVRSIHDFQLNLRSKLMGQVNLVRVGMNHVRDNGVVSPDARKFV